MGRSRRNKARAPQNKKPAYYNPKRVTIGMLEEVCRNTPDKTGFVSLADKNGSSPEGAVKILLLAGKNNQKGIVICGKFNWGTQEEQDAVDGVDYEDEMNDAYAWGPYMAAQNRDKSSCGVHLEEPGDCMSVDGKQTVYLGEPPSENEQKAV